MDPITGLAVIGIGYLAVRKTDVVKAADIPPNIPSPKPIIADKAKAVINTDAKVVLGTLSGAAIGALVGGQLGEWAVESWSFYDAPTTKSLAIPVFTVVGAVAGGWLAAGFLTGSFSIIGIGAITAAAACIYVLVAFVAVYAIFTLAVMIEDTVRYNETMRRQRIVIGLAEDKKYLQASQAMLADSQDGYNTGWCRLGPNATAYQKGSFAATGLVEGGKYGLSHEVTIPALQLYDYDNYFGVDGAEQMKLNNGAPFDVRQALKDAQYPMQQIEKAFVAKMLRRPTSEEWEVLLDSVKEGSRPGAPSLREYRDAVQAFGERIAPAFPWITPWYFDAYKPKFTLTPAQKAALKVETDTAKAETQVDNISGQASTHINRMAG